MNREFLVDLMLLRRKISRNRSSKFLKLVFFSMFFFLNFLLDLWQSCKYP